MFNSREINFLPLKDTQAKVEVEDNGGILTFSTEEAAINFINACKQYLQNPDYFLSINNKNAKQVHMSLEFAGILYNYPGADFTYLNELNNYTGFTKQSSENKDTQPIQSPSMDPEPKLKPSTSTLFFTSKSYSLNDNYSFTSATSDKECAKLFGQTALNEADKTLLRFLENCTDFQHLGLYLVKIHGYEAQHIVTVINQFIKANGDVESITPEAVIDFIHSKNQLDSLR